jgi:spoIIIJ-associated protein
MSKIDVTLENMNAFERRIIHNTLTNYPEIFTKSEGEDPNRHIIIKVKKEKESC